MRKAIIATDELSAAGTRSASANWRWFIPLLLTTAACGSSDARASLTRVDTLPGGVLSVRSDQPLWKDSTDAWSIVEEVRYGGEEGTPGELLDPQSFAADDAGRLYVVESKPAVVKVFSPDGSFLRTMGREGSGPGEFRVGFIATRRDRVVIHDPSEGRTSVFDTSGTFLKSAVTSCCYWNDIAIDTTMRIAVPALVADGSGDRSSGIPFVRFRVDLAPMDTFRVPGASEQREWLFLNRQPDGKEVAQMSMVIPFAPRLEYALHPWGGVVRGISNAYRIVRAPHGSDSTWIASRAWAAERIPESLRESRLQIAVKAAGRMVGESRARQVARLEDIPTVAPAFTRLAVDEEGNIWARQLVGSDSTQTTFDVLDPRGTWLGTVRVPYSVDEYGAAFFGRRAIYVKTEGEDGRPVIVRVRVRQ